MYVLQDNSFKPIARLSSWDGRQDAIKRAKVVRWALNALRDTLITLATQYVMMPAGIVRGALSRLGLIGVVVPEINTLPQCALPRSFLRVSMVNRLLPSNRYIPDKAAKNLMNRLSPPTCSYLDLWSSECSGSSPLTTARLDIFGELYLTL